MEKRSRVLLIDDDDFSAALVHDVLSVDYDISHATDGPTALETLTQITPDLILLDVRMPGMSGLELCRTLRDNPATQDLPVIFLSGMVTEEDRLAGYAAGGDDYLTKPVAAVDLCAKVKRALALSADRASIQQNLSEAVSTAMTALTSAAEIGVVLNFLRSSFTCPDYATLAKEALEVTGSYGLSASIQLRGNMGRVSLTAKGACSPLEEEILANIADHGRIVDFGHYTAFSYQRATVIVQNMPSDDPERYGRIKDNLALLLEATDARVAGLDCEHAAENHLHDIERLIASVREVLEDVDRALHQTDQDKIQIQEAFSSKLESAFAQMLLTQSQEAEVVDLTQRAFKESLALLGSERWSSESISALLDQFQRV